MGDPGLPFQTGSDKVYSFEAAVRILIIDDDVDGADALAALLTQSGHDVKVAYDGTQALGLAVAFAAEAAILDLAMPGMDGFEVAQALRHEYGTHLRLIAFSGEDDLATRRRVEATGFDEYLRKPACLASISTALQR